MELIDRKKDNLPNVIYILADDLGYGEVGFNGQKKIKTPNWICLQRRECDLPHITVAVLYVHQLVAL